MLIKGLKVENGAVFSLDEPTGKWERASFELIPKLEELLKKLESFSYPASSLRENIVFEKEFDVGLGSVKSCVDEDGDLVYTFHRDSHVSDDVQINEDLDFELSLCCSSSKLFRKSEDLCTPGQEVSTEELKIPPHIETGKEVVQSPETLDPMDGLVVENEIFSGHVSGSNKVVEDASETSSYQIHDTPLSSLSKTAQSTIGERDSRMSQNMATCCLPGSLNYGYVRRIGSKGSNECKAALRSMLELFSSSRYHAHSSIQGPPGTSKISYIKKDTANVKQRLNAGLIKGSLRYNRLYKTRSIPESEFYLEELNSDG